MKNVVLMISTILWLLLPMLSMQLRAQQKDHPARAESRQDFDHRMRWWREARFGLFIHWGLYAIPAGEWQGGTNHAEWIRNTAQIPRDEYDKFVARFNPTQFDADAWVRAAKDAGMKYIVITSKHHDGFCLFDSKFTDFDVMSTPFRRDVLHDLAEACRRHGLKICWYYSIMDWHHPDYLPRRDWEKDRPVADADFERYVQYMKSELKELLTNYGDIGVLWFDGEWESTWTIEHAKDLYDYVRSLQPNIIINNRVSPARAGMAGMTRAGEFGGDFGTPEQQIPATGLPGVDWESCLTMNDHWGYNKNDHHWKSSKMLLQMLADIASKGGNFLLNIGPTSAGLFPPPSLERLRDLGKWMQVNGESIYATQASPFASLDWGRCTWNPIDGGSRLYLHVFDWPRDGQLVVPSIANQPRSAYLLADAKRRALPISRHEDALIITVPQMPPDSINTVVVLEVKGKPEVDNPPTIVAAQDIFIDTIAVKLSAASENTEIRYTLDGTIPGKNAAIARAPIQLRESATIAARIFRNDAPVSGTTKRQFTKVRPRPAVQVENVSPGVHYAYFVGEWEQLPDFATLTPVKQGVLANFDLAPRQQNDNFGFQYTGFIRMPRDGVYTFSTVSDDGSRLYIDDQMVVDNDGLHGLQERTGVVALAAGLHPIRVTFFERGGEQGLEVYCNGPGIADQRVADALLWRPLE